MSTSSSAPILLLVLHDTQNEAEPLVNLFRNAGHATRSHFVASDEEMSDVLMNQTWDLILAKLNTETVNVANCVQLVSKLGKDIPSILLLDEYDPDEVLRGIRLGAKDVVVEAETDHILNACIRGIGSLKSRRKLRDNEIHLRESEKRVQLLLENSKDAIAYVHEGMHIYANQSYMEMFGYDDIDDLLCMPVMDMVEADKLDELKKCLKAYTEGENAELDGNMEHESGEQIPVHMAFSGATYDSEPCTQIIIRRNDEGSAELQQKIKEISTQDLLTGLTNRQYFLEQLDLAYQKAVKTQSNSTLVYIHLRDFGDLRANVGMAGADIVITDMANILKEKVKSGIIVSRLGDDVFGLLIPSDKIEAVKKLSANIHKSMTEHLSEVNGRTVQVKASVGLSLVDEQCENGPEALTHAHQASDDTASEDDDIKYFDKNDLANIADDNMVARVNHALENNGFRILYQPVISLRGDGQEHYEVFLRMLDKEGEEVPPSDFLPAAHAANIAGKIDRWVVGHTIKDLSRHRAKGHSTKVLISLTPASISDPTFLPWVNGVLKEHRLPGDAVAFQLAEDDAQNYLKAAKAFNKGLSVLRCKLALSHFGRLENGISLTKHLDIDYIKVHGSYVEDMESEAGLEKLEAVIKSIHEHDIASIVPQIESASVLSSLWQAGANYIQGFLLQGPATDMSYDFNEEGEEAV